MPTHPGTGGVCKLADRISGASSQYIWKISFATSSPYVVAFIWALRSASGRLETLTILDGEQCEQEADVRLPVKTGEHYLLLAGDTLEHVATVYDFLIGGDPAGASVELVPAGRAPGHRWRYLMIMRQSAVPSLICFPRIGRSARMLENGKLARFCGQIAVNPDFYDTVQALRAHLEQRPTLVREAMNQLYTQCANDIVQTRVQLRHIVDKP